MVPTSSPGIVKNHFVIGNPEALQPKKRENRPRKPKETDIFRALLHSAAVSAVTFIYPGQRVTALGAKRQGGGEPPPSPSLFVAPVLQMPGGRLERDELH